MSNPTTIPELYNSIIHNLKQHDSNSSWNEILVKNNGDYNIALGELIKALEFIIEQYTNKGDLDTLRFYKMQLYLLIKDL
jgi:hypothetical protein